MFEANDVLPEDASESDAPLLTQCSARESGGHLCEAVLTDPDQPHEHWISDETIRSHCA